MLKMNCIGSLVPDQCLTLMLSEVNVGTLMVLLPDEGSY